MRSLHYLSRSDGDDEFQLTPACWRISHMAYISVVSPSSFILYHHHNICCRLAGNYLLIFMPGLLVSKPYIYWLLFICVTQSFYTLQFYMQHRTYTQWNSTLPDPCVIYFHNVWFSVLLHLRTINQIPPKSGKHDLFIHHVLSVFLIWSSHDLSKWLDIYTV